MTDEAGNEVPDLFIWSSAKQKLDKLISDYKVVQKTISANRKERHKDFSIRALRDQKKLAQNQFLLAVRVIDTNILRELPAYINYTINSNRIAIFKNKARPFDNVTDIENEFTAGITYPSWEVPFIKCFDGALTHGWDFMEVCLDTSKPLHLNFEHCGTDNILFPTDTVDLQEQEFVLRRYYPTVVKLKSFIKKYGFDPVQVDTLIKYLEQSKRTTIAIYKKYCKYEDVVYVSWFCPDKCSDWLKAPAPLYMGRDELMPQAPPPQVEDPAGFLGLPLEGIEPPPPPPRIPETAYPLFVLPYTETEQIRLIDHKGRVFKDRHKQEAMSANLSQFINGCQQASELNSCLKAPTDMTASKLEQVPLGPGKICPLPLEFFQAEYPQPVMLALSQYLDALNSQETGQVNYAVNNRKDTRKTAEELKQAKEESVKISTTQLVVLSTFLRDIFTYSWNIVQNRALQGLIPFLIDPDTGQNNLPKIAQNYEIRAAGDVDVVKKQELLTTYEKYWPITSTLPQVAIPYLSRMLSLAFGSEGDMYVKLLGGGDPLALIQGLTQMLSALAEITADGMTPEQQSAIAELLMQAQMYVANTAGGGGANGESGNSGGASSEGGGGESEDTGAPPMAKQSAN